MTQFDIQIMNLVNYLTDKLCQIMFKFETVITNMELEKLHRKQRLLIGIEKSIVT